MTIRIPVLAIAWLAATCSQLSLAAESGSGSPGVVQKVEHAAQRGARAAAHGVERGAKATASVTSRGVRATERGLSRAAKATEHGVHAAARKISGSAPASPE